MNKHHYRFDGTLTRMPHPNKPSLAQARMMPVENENDFAVFAELPPSDMPIWLSFSEHHRLLADIVENAQKLWPDELTILVRISMPAGWRLPKPLLLPNVLLCQEIEPELSKVKTGEQNVLVIEDFFVRFQIERGENQMHIGLYSQDEQQDNFNQLVAPLETLGIVAS